MSTTNILISGVGGQGLVLATGILAEVAFREGFDIKTSDVIGLSQRGGMVWGSVRFGKCVHSSMIPEGETNILLAMEKLEALRWCHLVAPSGKVIINEEVIFPNRVLIEKEEFPLDINEKISFRNLEVISVNAKEKAKLLGNPKVANIYLMGVLSRYLPFNENTWLEVIKNYVPEKTLEINLKAFNEGHRV